MSKVKIQGNASGTGVVTLTAPNTNTDRTITLPDGDISLGVGIDDNATSTAITIDASENVTFGGNVTTANLTSTGQAVDFKKDNSTSHRKVEFFDSVSLSTSYADLVSVAVGTTHQAYYYEIIFYGSDWSGHSSARAIKRGFINGGDTYTGHNVVESSGKYGGNMILNVVWSGTTSTIQLKLDSGSVEGTYYAKLIGRIPSYTIA